jgi:hypothetical protein
MSQPKEKQTQEEEVAPPEDLMREHGVLKRVLLVYREVIRRVDAHEEVPVTRYVTLPASSGSSSRTITRSSRKTICSPGSKKLTSSRI